MQDWQPIETAPRRKSRRPRPLIQLYGNDRWERRLRVVPGYIGDDGEPIAMDDMGSSPFNARFWRPLAAAPRTITQDTRKRPFAEGAGTNG